MFLNTQIILEDLKYDLQQYNEFNVEFFYITSGSQLRSLFTIYRVFIFKEYKDHFELYHCYCNKYGKTVLSKKNIFWRYV